MPFKKTRIPVIPCTDPNKAINGEIIISNNSILYNDNGNIIELTKNSSSILKTGRINLIKGTAFNDDVIPDNFSTDGYILLFQENNSLAMNYISTESKLIIDLSDSIEKNKKYTISFKAHSSIETDINISFDSFVNYNFHIDTKSNTYNYTFDTSQLSVESIKKIYITSNTKCTVYISKLLLEEGTEVQEWIESATFNLTLNRLISSNIDVLDGLTIKGKPLLDVLQGNKTTLITTADDIVTSEDYIEEQSTDSNYETVCVQLKEGENEVICNKEFKDLLYGTYYIILRVKTSSNIYEDNPILNITTSEYIEEIDQLTLLSSTDIYEVDFHEINEYEELGLIVPFKGYNSMNNKTMNVTITMIGNKNEPKINIDYIILGQATPSFLPLYSEYK